MKSNRTLQLACLVFALFLVTVWLVFEPYPSHYVSGLRTLGDTVTQALWGTAKDGRGDEWSTYLPMLKQAAREGFPDRSSLEPYKEKLIWFIALPKADISLLFLPNYLAYWIFPAGKALSFQGFFYYILLLGSIFWYLRNMRVDRSLAIVAAISVAFSQLYQVWWTSNFPALATCFLPFAILTSSLRPVVRNVLLFWAIGHMAFGQMYPPTYFAVAVALVPLTLAARPDLLNRKTLAAATLAAAAALAIYWFWNADFIAAVSDTSYPGRRFSAGGGSTLAALTAALFPTIPVTPVPGGDATYELSMAGTLFPLMLLPLLPYIRWDRDTVRITIVAGLLLLVLCVYATIGFPTVLAKWTGFFVMPGRRAHPGISLILVVYASIVISRNRENWKFGAIAAVLIGYAVISFVLGVRSQAANEFWGIGIYAYLPLVFLLLAWTLARIKRSKLESGPSAGYLVLAGMAVAHVLMFGSFNPVMRGSDIMAPVHSQFITDWKALYEKNGHKPFAVDGNVGHLLRGEGLPALEAIHLVNVDRDIYRRVFPNLSDSEITEYFNRFVGIAFDNIEKVEPRGATVVFALKPQAVPFPHRVISGQKPGPNFLAQHPNVVVTNPRSGDGYIVRWKGALAEPLPISREMNLVLPCEVKDSWLTRSPVPGLVGAAADGVSLRALSGEMRVSAGNSAQAKLCVEALSVQ
ncbi:DUF7657 domain-containing protein [Achromobacter xylosoxidans]|uniref:DUF7657 domain-containing protein n=1 Tax=Alcaligenes xylosoxydans xylosoxydans TaxID=85698 RepID=UPI001F12DB66|nr:hypothetical protein [Achromobacter xylosoxidans]